MSLITLSRKDPDFNKYLDGSFSKTERALPLQTLNPNSESESVSFQIVPLSEVKRPGFFSLWIQVFKLRSFTLLAFPIFVILAKDLFDDELLDSTLVILSIFASLALLVGANLLNDYFDHMRGLDRIHPDSDKKPIQLGWVTARETKNWAAVYLTLGVLLGLPAIFVEPQILVLVAVPAAVALWAWLSPKKGLRFRRGAEVMVFLLAGPLFTIGFQWAVSGLFDLETVWIGVMSGWIAVYLVHLKNFSALVVNTQAKFHSTVVRLGFERSKVLLSVWWLALWASYCSYQWFYFQVEWFGASLLIGAASTVYMIKRFGALRSPVGSDMRSAVFAGRAAVNLFWGWWMIQCFWILLVVELSSIPLDGP